MSDIPEQPRQHGDLIDAVDGFALQSTTAPVVAPSAPAPKSRRQQPPKPGSDEGAQILSYRHADRRVNNPEVGMVTPATDPDAGRTRWAYDPHLDPELRFDPSRAQIEALIDAALESGDPERMREALEELKRLQSPYLAWAGKAERTSFEVDLVSLHVHERIDPMSILSAVRKAMKGEGRSKGDEPWRQAGLFEAPFENRKRPANYIYPELVRICKMNFCSTSTGVSVWLIEDAHVSSGKPWSRAGRRAGSPNRRIAPSRESR